MKCRMDKEQRDCLLGLIEAQMLGNMHERTARRKQFHELFASYEEDTVFVDSHSVKKLREITGRGMEECKKALIEVKGDREKAADLLIGAKKPKSMSQPTELEMHRADYQACKAAGFESPGELLSAYKTLLKKVAGLPCINAGGFEGAETFGDCKKCFVCYAKCEMQNGKCGDKQSEKQFTSRHSSALNRAAIACDNHAKFLMEKNDYSSELSADDAEALREVLKIMEGK